MTSESELFDPEFEAILREVASDPRSSLLRVKRPQRLGELYDRYEPISAQATALTKAERHLVQVHRNEVAWLLRQACLIKLIEGPSSKEIVSRYSGPGKEVRLLTPGEVQAGVRERRERSSVLDECAHGLELLDQCVADRQGESPNVAELATAAFRLEPTDQARVMVGIDLFFRGDLRSSLRLAQDVLMERPEESIAIPAWECVASCFGLMGDLGRTYDAYKQSSGPGERRTLSNLACVVFGLQLGLRQDVLANSRMLDDSVSRADPVVDWFVDALVNRRRAGQWAPTPDGARLAASLRDRLGIVGGRIANVLT